MKNLGNPGNISVAFLATLGIPFFAGKLATHSAGLFGHADPGGVYLWASLHHIWQFVLTIAAMLLFSRALREWGFNLDNAKDSLKLLRWFFVWYTSFVVAGHLLLYFLAPPPSFGHPLTRENVLGELGFKLLLSGTCEEPLFRGFVMVLVYQSMRGIVRVGRIEISHAGILATLFFMMAHIGYTVWPFSITFFSPVQQVQALALGLFYAAVFHRTKSLLTPILVHNYFNFSLTALGMLWAWLKH